MRSTIKKKYKYICIDNNKIIFLPFLLIIIFLILMEGLMHQNKDKSFALHPGLLNFIATKVILFCTV